MTCKRKLVDIVPRGDCVCVVGEWDGDTAQPAFTAQLLAGFRLVDRCALPNWTDTAHELTVWERRSADGNEVRQSTCQRAQSLTPSLIYSTQASLPCVFFLPVQPSFLV